MNTKYEPYRRISCGCCTGDGRGAIPGNDQCTCWIHQDVPHGRPQHVCAHHKTLEAERAAPAGPRDGLSSSTVDISTINEYGLTQKLSNSVRCF